MKIGINASWMTPGMAGGMEWYVRNLIDQLGALDQDNDYVLVTGPNNYKTFKLPSSRWKMVVYFGHENSPMTYRVSPDVPARASQPFALLHQFHRRLRYLHIKDWKGKFADLIAGEGIDLWFCPIIYALPVDTSVPVVVTIPDLQHEHYPAFFHEDELALRIMGYQYSCQAATAVIGISRYVSDEIVKLYAVDAAKVFATPLALDQSYQISKEEIERLVNEVKLKFRLDKDFIFYPANGWHHKNHENLVRAMDIIHRKKCQLGLILTGCEFDVMNRLRPLLNRPSLREAVRHLGYIDRQDLFGLYAASKMLAFPSFFEGFGLPLLEAMQFNVPVACSNLGSLREVGGDAVWYFDPRSPQDIAEAILRVSYDQDLRGQLIAAGRNRVKCFSYSNTARHTLSIFGQIRDGILTPPDLPSFRPLIAHNWLREGHSRWYFHANSLREVRIEVIQPTLLDALEDQTVKVILDGQKVLESAIVPQRVYRFTLPAHGTVEAGFHELDISASATVSVGGEILSIQVPSITLSDSSGRELRLIK